MALVHKETSDNFAWFFANCYAAGLDLADCILFTDRGKQLNACELLNSIGLPINLKFCSYHISLNVADKFGLIEDDAVRARSLVMKLQATRTFLEYEMVMQEIRSVFPMSPDRDATSVASYLGSIHPTSWTRFGNCIKLNPAETIAIDTHWHNVPVYGKPLPLFRVRTTGAVEGENNALLWDGLRDQIPPHAMISFGERCVDKLARRRDLLYAWKRSGCNVTTHAKALYEIEKWKTPNNCRTHSIRPLATQLTPVLHFD